MVRVIKNKNFFQKLKSIDRHLLYSYVFFAVITVTSAITFYLVKERADIRQRASQNGADVILAFDRSSATKGQTLTMDVNVVSNTVPIQEVRFDFSYPSSKTTANIVYDNKNFETMTEEIIGSGIIRFGRSSKNALSGKLHVGQVQFNPITDIYSNEIAYLNTTELIAINNKKVPLFQLTKVDPTTNSTQHPVSYVQKITDFIKNLFW